MNKLKMGQFIRDLRKEVEMSQEDLSQEFDKRHLTVSKKGISEWENGKTIPNIENLRELADLFNVTIDEILDGERRNDVDLNKKYFISDPNWTTEYYEKGEKLFDLNQKQIIEIVATFNGLLEKRVQRELTFSEEKEFRFLFEHFYKLTGYDPNNEESEGINTYLAFKSAVRTCLSKMTDMSDDEKIFEIRKMIRPNNEIEFHFGHICDEVPEKDGYFDQRFRSLDFWEKDMILAVLQKEWPTVLRPNTRSTRSLKDYEKTKGKEYNEETIVKSIIRYLIENGACLNRRYMNSIVREKKEYRIIDRVEKLYALCKRPIECPVIMKNGETKRYVLDNTKRNRFFGDYWFKLRLYFSYSPEELYQLFCDNEILTDEMTYDLAKEHHIDTDQERKYLMADIYGLRINVMDKWKECHDKEKAIQNGEIELERLVGMLKNGAIYEDEIVERVIGGNDSKEITDYCYYWNRDMTRESLMNSRMVKETEELLDNLDVLSLNEIREKYFRMEVIEDAEC